MEIAAVTPISQEAAEALASVVRGNLGPDSHTPACSELRAHGFERCTERCVEIRAALQAAGRLAE